MEEETNRNNLKEYYDAVVTCKSCSKQYGFDKSSYRKKDNSYCPKCMKGIYSS